jgi:PAS domain S-box-containing protein
MADTAERERAYEALRKSEDLFAMVFRASPVPITISRLADGAFLDANEAFVHLLGYERAELMGRSSLSLGLHVDPQLRQTVVKQVAANGSARNVELALRAKSGEVFHMLANIEPLVVAGEPFLLTAAYDLTDRRRAEKTIALQSERARFMADVSRTFAEAGLDYRNVLRVAVERAAQLIGDACVVTLASDDRQRVNVVAYHHPNPTALAVMHETLRHWSGSTDTPPFSTLLAGEPIRMTELVPEQVGVSPGPELRPSSQQVGFSSKLIVPLRVQGRVIGTLGLTRDPHGAPYTLDDQILLQDLADRAALAIQSARLFQSVSEHREELRTLSAKLVETQEAERRTIARELHDEVGQLLTSLKFLLAAQDRTGTSVERKQLTEMAGRILERIEDLSLDLRPPMLDDLGLVPALLWHFARYESQTRVHVGFHHRGVSRRFESNTELALFRIVQEALTNVARHAGVDEAHVEIWTSAGNLCARIEDDGRGYDPATLEAPSSGLTGMRERASLLGGSLAIDSQVRAGVRVLASLPIGAPRAADTHA